MGEKTLFCSSSVGGFNFVRGIDDELVQAGALQRRTFHDFSGGYAPLPRELRNGGGRFARFVVNFGNFWAWHRQDSGRQVVTLE